MEENISITLHISEVEDIIEDHSNIEFKKNPLIQRNLKIHTIIADAMKREEE